MVPANWYLIDAMLVDIQRITDENIEYSTTLQTFSCTQSQNWVSKPPYHRRSEFGYDDLTSVFNDSDSLEVAHRFAFGLQINSMSSRSFMRSSVSQLLFPECR